MSGHLPLDYLRVSEVQKLQAARGNVRSALALMKERAKNPPAKMHISKRREFLLHHKIKLLSEIDKELGAIR